LRKRPEISWRAGLRKRPEISWRAGLRKRPEYFSRGAYATPLANNITVSRKREFKYVISSFQFLCEEEIKIVIDSNLNRRRHAGVPN